MQFQWMNESRLSESENRLELYAPAHTDFFYSSESAGRRALRPSRSATRPITIPNSKAILFSK